MDIVTLMKEAVFIYLHINDGALEGAHVGEVWHGAGVSFQTLGGQNMICRNFSEFHGFAKVAL